MTKQEFYRKIERGVIQGACRYLEYAFVYDNINPGEKVLELGGGHSVLALTIHEKGCEVHVTELDQGPYMHHHNLSKGRVGYTAHKVEDERLPFADGSLDVVVSASSIEHFDPDNDGDLITLEEVHRVLKPGGKFIITIPVYREYIKNRYAGHPIHPPEKVYNAEEYNKRFLNKFAQKGATFWRWSNKMPTDYIPHHTWVARGGIVSTAPATGFNDAHGLCAVLIKL